jgi:hypothetical protein
LKSIREQDVTAQCRQCLDLFDVTLINRRGEITVVPTQAIGFNAENKLVHRPGHCEGQVVLIWTGYNGPIFGSHENYDPLAR